MTINWKNTKPFVFTAIIFAVCAAIVLVPLRRTNPLPTTDNQSLVGEENSPQEHISTPNNSPYPSPGKLSILSEKRDNPSQTRTFFYSSDTPAFSSTEGSNFWGYQSDPFEIRFNGDTRYFTSKGSNSRNDVNIIKPEVLDFATNNTQALTSLDKGLTTNGYTQVLGWVDDDYLVSRTCTGDIGSGCNFDLIDVQNNNSVPYARGISVGLLEIHVVNQVHNYFFSQQCRDLDPCEIKIFKDIQINDLKNSFDSFTPIHTLPTSKYLLMIDMDETNTRNLNREIKIFVSKSLAEKSKDGYFIFDLENGTISASDNL